MTGVPDTTVISLEPVGLSVTGWYRRRRPTAATSVFEWVWTRDMLRDGQVILRETMG